MTWRLQRHLPVTGTMTRRFCIGLIGLTMPASAFAQILPPSAGSVTTMYIDRANGLTLDQAIDHALKHEPTLLAARADIDRARGMRIQAGLRPNPMMSTERREEPGGSDTQTAIGVEWPLDLFRRAGRVAVADREIVAVRSAAEDRERVLIADVRTRYGEVLVAARVLDVIDELASATRRQLDVLRARVDEGAAPALERDLLDVELRRIESERVLQLGRADAALFQLKQVLGLPAGTPLRLGETLDDLLGKADWANKPPAEDEAAIAQQRSDVRQALADIGVAEARTDRARREGRIDVGLFGSYMRMDAGFPQRGFTIDGVLQRVRGQFNYLTFGAKITLPLTDRKQGEIAAGEAERRRAEALREAAQLAAQAEIATARARDERAREALALYTKETRNLARQNLTVVTQTYELGRATVFDVLAEQRRYLDLERAYIDVLSEAYQARAALKLALGEAR